jgi:MFS family permease
VASVEQAPSDVAGKPDSGPVVLPGRRGLGAPFWRLWCAAGISGSGDGLVTVAVPLLTVALTRNPLIIAGATAANRAAAAIAALPAGLIADRVDRRRLMVGCNLVAGVALMALVVAMSLGSADLVMAYLVAIILEPCYVTFTLAMQASVPALTPYPDQLGVANGRLIAVEGAGQQFIGPGSGGYLFALARRLPFLADGISFFISAFLVSSSFPRARREGLHAKPSDRYVADLRDPPAVSYVADLRDSSSLRSDADARSSAPGSSGTSTSTGASMGTGAGMGTGTGGGLGAAGTGPGTGTGAGATGAGATGAGATGAGATGAGATGAGATGAGATGAGATGAGAGTGTGPYQSAARPPGVEAYQPVAGPSGASGYQAASGTPGASARLPGSADEFDLGTAAGRDDLAKARGQHTSGWVAAFLEGLRVFRKEPSLKMLAATVSALAFCQFMVIGVLVVYGTRTLHLSSTRYGLFLAAASIVGVVGAFSAGTLQRRFGGGRLIVWGSAAAAISYMGLSFTRSAVLAVFVLGLQDFGVAVANVASVTARQQLVPRSLLGRVSSVHRLAVLGAAPFGAVVGGLVASAFNAPDAMLAAGLILGVALAILSAPLLRSLAASARRNAANVAAPTAQPAGS